MSFITSLGSQSLTTSNATLGIAVPTGQIWRIRAVNIQQPTTGLAKNVALALGTTATAGNVKLRYAIAAGLQKVQDFPELVMVAADQLNVISDADTGVAIISVTVVKELIA